MSVSSPFFFGFELELSIKTNRKHSTWHDMADQLSKRLRKRHIHIHVNDISHGSENNYSEWSIVQEITIPAHPSKNICKSLIAQVAKGNILTGPGGLELVSPVFDLDCSWVNELEAIFKELSSLGTLQRVPQCSTHVHVSLKGGMFSPWQLAVLSRASLSFESFIDSCGPANRSSSYWCQSNRASPALQSCRSLQDCFEVINNASTGMTSLMSIVKCMCLFPAASAYGRAHGFREDFIHGKVYKWNFARLIDPEAQSKTIEFRQPAGSTSAREAVGWVLFGLALVAGSTGFVDTLGLMTDEPATPMNFREYLYHGASMARFDSQLLAELVLLVDRSLDSDKGGRRR
jgi:hypothetical protein